MQLYPRWKYKYGQDSVIVDDAEGETDLGAGWFDSPTEASDAAGDAAASEAAASAQAATDLETLRATAVDLGITVDGRWGASRLEDEIKAKIEAEHPPTPEAQV